MQAHDPGILHLNKQSIFFVFLIWLLIIPYLYNKNANVTIYFMVYVDDLILIGMIMLYEFFHYETWP